MAISPICLAFLLSSSLLGVANAAPIQTQWEVERIISPDPIDATGFSAWGSALPLGGIIGGSRCQFVASGSNSVGFVLSDQNLVSGGLGAAEFPFEIPAASDYQPFGIWWNPGFALLKTPSGFQAVARRNPTFLDFLDFPTGGNRVSIIADPPNAGELAHNDWQAFWNAGDINQDGFDDLFYQATTPGLVDGYTGLIDGASHQVVWRKYAIWASQIRPITPDPTTGFPDLNGDSIPDFVSGWLYAVPPYTSFNKELIAYSGLDGSIIWDVRIGGGADFGTSGRDINGDGVADIVTIGLPFNLFAVDGATGNVLWVTPIASVEAIASGSGTDYRYAPLVFFEDVSEQGTAATVSVAYNRDPIGGINGVDHYIAKLDATDGTPLSVSPMASDLNPWLDDFVRPNNNLSFLLGDIDRDGYTEIAQHVDTPSLDPGGVWPPGASTSLAILGPSTITVPGGHSIGQTNTVSFDIPSASNMLLQLAISTEFDPKGGVKIDNWPTNLAPSRMLTWSRGQNLVTTLDQDGAGSIDLTLPNNAALVGEDFYLRGIVWEPSAPFVKVWTISSVGHSIVLP